MSVAILSLIIVLPAAAAIVWQRHSRALWGSLFFGFGAFAVNGLVQIPLGQVLTHPLFGKVLAPFPDIFMLVPTAWIIMAFTIGLFREGIRWLILFFPATSVRTWKEGVLFGLGYSCLVALQHLGEYVSKSWEEIELFQYSFVETMELLNRGISWEEALYFALAWGVVETIFNVGTCLLVMFSVRRLNVWLFLAAVLWHGLYSELPRVLFFSSAGWDVFGIHPYYRGLSVSLLSRTLVTLLPLLLFFDLRRGEDFSKIVRPGAVIGATAFVCLAWVLVVLFLTFGG